MPWIKRAITSCGIVCAAPHAIDRDHEQPDREQEDALAAVDVGDAPVQRHRRDLPEQVAADDPRDAAAPAEVAGDRGQRGRDDGGVHRRHHHGELERQEDDEEAARSTAGLRICLRHSPRDGTCNNRHALPPSTAALSASDSGGVDDLREQVADASPDRVRVQVGAEHDALGAELVGEVLDEVEVVAEAGVEHDVRCDLGRRRSTDGSLRTRRTRRGRES